MAPATTATVRHIHDATLIIETYCEVCERDGDIGLDYLPDGRTIMCSDCRAQFDGDDENR